MTTSHSVHTAAWVNAIRVGVVGLLILGSMPAQGQDDPPSLIHARGPEATASWLPGLTDAATVSSPPPVGESVQSAAGRLTFQSFRDGNWEIYGGSDEGAAAAGRLTSDPAADLEPRLSPDTRQIVFTSKRSGNYDIWLMNADGSGLRQLTNDPATDSAPAWSPDGTLIAFTSARGNNTDVYVLALNSGALTRLTTQTDYDGEPAWSPDGAQIAFVSKRSSGAYDFFLYTMAADGSAQSLRSAVPYAARPNWSTDGRQILFDGLSASGWQRLYLYTLANNTTQSLDVSGIYIADYEVWAGSWGQGGQAYATLVGYILYEGKWYIESMTLLTVDTVAHVASGLNGNRRDAMPDWRSADRLPPRTILYPQSPFVVARQGAGITFTGRVEDQGIAGVDHVETQYRLPGGEWQTLTQSCSIYDSSFNCMVMPPLHDMQIRARGVDRMGNAEAWPETSNRWATVSLYRLKVDGQVTDLRGLSLTGVPLGGAPSIEADPSSGADGRYLFHVPDLTAPIVFTLTASLSGGAAGTPRPYVLDALPFGANDPAVVEDFALRPTDQALVDPSFETPAGIWAGAGGFVSQWFPATTLPLEPTRMQLGWKDGAHVLAASDLPPRAVTVGDATLIVFHDPTLGTLFQRCVTDQLCDPVEAIGGEDVLALGAAGDGTAAVLLRVGTGTVVRTRTPAGVWSAPKSLLAGDGTAHSLLAGPGGDWHAVWNGPTGLVVLSHRNVDGTWTAPVNIGGLTHERYATRPVFDLQGRLHVPFCASSGLLDMIWSVADGLQGPIDLGSDVCSDLVGLRASLVDDAGNVYVARAVGDAVRMIRISPGDVVDDIFGVGATEFSTVGIVRGEGGRPALILADYTPAHYQNLLIGQLTPTDEWAITRLPIFQPAYPLNQQYLALNQAAERLLVQRAAAPGFAPMDSIAEQSFGTNGVEATAARQVTLGASLHRPTLGLTYRHTDLTATLALHVQAVGGTPNTVTQTLPPGVGWQRAWMDLTSFAGQTLTVTVSLQGAPGSWPVADFDEIVLGSWTTPLVTSVSPAVLDAPSGVVTLVGDNFMGTPTVTLGGVTTPVAVVDAQHLSVTIPASLGYGRHAVVVTNPDGFATTSTHGLQIGRGVLFLPVLMNTIPGGWNTR